MRVVALPHAQRVDLAHRRHAAFDRHPEETGREPLAADFAVRLRRTHEVMRSDLKTVGADLAPHQVESKSCRRGVELGEALAHPRADLTENARGSDRERSERSTEPFERPIVAEGEAPQPGVQKAGGDALVLHPARPQDRQDTRPLSAALEDEHRLEAGAIRVTEAQRAAAGGIESERPERFADTAPELFRADTGETRSRSSDLRERLQRNQSENVAAAEQTADDERQLVEIRPRHGHRRRGTQSHAGAAAHGADFPCELVAQRLEVGLRPRCAILAPTTALQGIDVESDLRQAGPDQVVEQAVAPAQGLAVGHQHRDQAEPPGFAYQPQQLHRGQQRHLAVGELEISLRAEVPAQQGELGVDLRRLRPGHGVGLAAEIAAVAVEVASRQHADRRAAAGRLPAEPLQRGSPARVELPPALGEQAALLAGDRLGKERQGVTKLPQRAQGRHSLAKRSATLCLVLLSALFLSPSPAAAAAEFSHGEWTDLLQRFVDDQGRVDYAALARDRSGVDRYLASLAAQSPDSAKAHFPTRDDELAYWINAYNAVVVAGVLDRGIATPSVWGDGFFGIGFFTVERATLGGRRMSLKRLEDEKVRKRFRDPRVHAALNCASVGCPRLPRRAFEGPSLQAELDAAMREFVADDRNCRIDLTARTVWLSKIFDWFDDDFLDYERASGARSPTVVDYVNRYRAADQRIPAGLRVRFLDYDKRLNRQEGGSPAAAARAASDPELDGLLRGGIDRGYPGLAIAVQQRDAPARFAALGESDLEHHLPMRTDDAFHMASIHKTFTAVAALRLVDQGKMRLTSTLSELLGSAVAHLPDAAKITVAQLLDHSSGIYPTNNDEEYIATILGPRADPQKVWSPAELVALASGERQKPVAAPGAGHHYSDTNYILLGMIIERVSGMPYKQLVTSTLLEPLGMTSTHFYSDTLAGAEKAVRPGKATVRGYLLATEELRQVVAIHPMFRPVPGLAPKFGPLLDTTLAAERIDAAAGLVTTLPDLLKFAAALFRGKLVSPASQAILFAAAQGLAAEPLGTQRVWTLQAMRKPWGNVLFKEGDSPGGFNTLMAYVPASDTVFLGFTNVFGHFDELDYLFDDVMGKVLGN